MNISCTCAHNRGFSLIELMVVISIIGLLASIVLGAVSEAKLQARNAARLQELHQIDTAIQLYMSDHNGELPPIAGTNSPLCQAQQDPTNSNWKNWMSNNSSACYAVSFAESGNSQAQAWDNLIDDLKSYIDVPKDPCGESCGAGYTYVAPGLLQYECVQNHNSNCSESAFTNSYSLTPSYESSSNSGSSGSGGSGGGSSSLPVMGPVSLAVASDRSSMHVDWSSTGATYCRSTSGNPNSESRIVWDVDQSVYEQSIDLGHDTSGSVDYQIPEGNTAVEQIDIVITCTNAYGSVVGSTEYDG